MSLNIIDEMLKAKTPKKRLKIILDQQAKNVKFFKRKSPELGELLEIRGAGRFLINVNQDFLDILDRNTNQLCHPAGKLLDYIRTLGAWHHDQWIDKLQVVHTIYHGIEHGEKLKLFLERVYEQAPYINERIASGVISLPKLKDGRRYSGTVAFLGIGSGLHIVNYLNVTQLRDLILIEPDIDSFCLSCYFIDYSELDKRIRLVLHVGPDMPESQLDILLNESPVTMAPWLRILPASPAVDYLRLSDRLHLRWRAATEIFVPFDREVRNLCYGMRNLKAKLPINYLPPKLSNNSRIAIVASGPSLINDLPWLKANQDKLIIFAAHSAVKVLKQHGIRPDFQCSLDTEIEDELMDKLDLYYDVPYVSYYKADPHLFEKFDTVLLLNEENKANSVKFHHFLNNTHPTTGNLTTSFAAFCKPSALYFVGLDLGFRSLQQEHVEGYWLGEEDIVGQRIQASLIPANFPESEGQIQTQAYYNSARMGIEDSIKPLLESGTQIFNLADGARIEGASPQHSDQLELDNYTDKIQDVNTIIRDGFSSQSDIWDYYKTSGEILIDTIRKSLLEAVTLKEAFDWTVFSRKLDIACRMTIARCSALESGDFRIEAFHKLLQDMLTEWYRIIIFTRSPSETKVVYEAGLKAIEEVLHTIDWPKELD